MEMRELKNLDKQVAGCRCYNTANEKWCDIVEVYSDYCVVRDVVTKAIYEEKRENLYPLAENVVTREYGLDLCHEIIDDIEYPYFCPAADSNFYDFEVVEKTKQDDDTKEEEVKEEVKEDEVNEDEVNEDNPVSVSINRANVRIILNTLIEGMEKTFNESFIKYSGKVSTQFIWDAIYGMYNPKDDTSLQNIFNLFNNHISVEVVNDLFNEHFLHPCQNNLITPELMKALDQKTIEELVENINCLDYDVLDKIYRNDTETIKEYRKKLGIDVLMDKHLKKTYKVKGTITQRYIVEVQASNWQEAKKKAMEDLTQPIPTANCNFVESIIEPKNWGNS